MTEAPFKFETENLVTLTGCKSPTCFSNSLNTSSTSFECIKSMIVPISYPKTSIVVIAELVSVVALILPKISSFALSVAADRNWDWASVPIGFPITLLNACPTLSGLLIKYSLNVVNISEASKSFSSSTIPNNASIRSRISLAVVAPESASSDSNMFSRESIFSVTKLVSDITLKILFSVSGLSTTCLVIANLSLSTNLFLVIAISLPVKESLYFNVKLNLKGLYTGA